MKICGSCGSPAGEEHSFCTRCGAPVVSASAPLPKPPADPEAQSRLQASGTEMLPSTGPPLATARFRLLVTRPNGSPGPSRTVDEPFMAGASADLRLEEDRYVAPEHACFGLRDGVVEVTDLPDSGGTWLGLAPASPVRVPPGGRIRAGNQVLCFEAVEPPQGSIPHAWGSNGGEARVRVLQIVEGGEPGAAWLLTEGTWTMGREGCTITISYDGFLSGMHARLVIGPGGSVTYEDLGSSNGSYLGLTETTRLGAGDKLLVGKHVLWVEHA